MRVLLPLFLALPLAGCGGTFARHVVDPTDPRGASNLSFLLSGLWPAVVLSVSAMALGLSPLQRFRFVIFPQALRRVLPPLGNQFVYVVKMSSLASVIGYEELTRRANELTVTVFRPLEIYTVLVLEYLALVLVISAGVRWMERRLGADQGLRREG